MSGRGKSASFVRQREEMEQQERDVMAKKKYGKRYVDLDYDQQIRVRDALLDEPEKQESSVCNQANHDAVVNYAKQYVTALMKLQGETMGQMSRLRTDLDVLAAYLSALGDLRQKVTQQNAVECQQLMNVYSEGVKNRVAAPFLDLVAHMLRDTRFLMQQKQKINAAEWALHDQRVMDALRAVAAPTVPLPLPPASGSGSASIDLTVEKVPMFLPASPAKKARTVETVEGGARHRRQHEKQARKAVKYCGCRCNAYYQALLQKLMRDRQRHQNLMKELHYHAIKLLGGAAPMTQMVSTMVHDQKIFDARRTQLDAQHWADLARSVKGGGCSYMLRAGGCCVTTCE